MSNPDLWMPLYIGDYLADTMHLSAEEHGAYILLIMHYWRNGAIKNDKNSIKNIAKISTKKAEKILEFFELKDGHLYHKRIEEELLKAAENQEKNKERTKKATEARKEKTQRNDRRNDDVTTIGTFTPSPSPLSSLQSDNITTLQTLVREDISDWLLQQEMIGNKITIDVRMEIERFRSHFTSSGGKDKYGKKIEGAQWIGKLQGWILNEQKQQKYGGKSEITRPNGTHQRSAGSLQDSGKSQWASAADEINAAIDRGEF